MLKYFPQLYCTCVIYNETNKLPQIIHEKEIHWPILLWKISDVNETEKDFLKEIINMGCKVNII